MKCGDFERAVKDALLSYFGEKLQVIDEEGICLVVLPFLRPDNDFIEIIVQEREGELMLSDRGATFAYLFFNGVDFKRGVINKKTIEGITSNFRVKTDYEELWIYSNLENLGQDISNLVHTIQSISHLIFRQKVLPERDFHKIVKANLNKYNIKNVTENSKVMGYSITHIIDFEIKVNASNFFMETLYASNKGIAKKNAKLTAFKWLELEKASIINGKGKSISVVDDKIEDVWDETNLNILKKYSDYTFMWSVDKEELFGELLAPSRTLD